MTTQSVTPDGAEYAWTAVIDDAGLTLIETDAPAVGVLLEHVFTGAAEITITGQAATADLTLTIVNGALSLTGVDYVERDGVSADTTDIVITNLALELDAALTQSGADGVTLSGLLRFDFQGLSSTARDDFVIAAPARFLTGPSRTVSLSTLSAALEAVGVSFSGTLAQGADTVGLTLSIDAEGRNLTDLETPTPLTLAEYSTSNGALSVEFYTGTQWTMDVVPPEEAFDFRSSIRRDTDRVREDNGIEIFRDETTGRVVARIGLTNEREDVFRLRQTSPNGEILTVLTQPTRAGAALRSTPIETFNDNPPAGVVDYWNAAVGDNDAPALYCANDVLVLGDPLSFSAVSGTIPGVVIHDDYDCAALTLDSAAVLLNAQTRGGISDDAVADALVSVSLRKDIVGVDPDDPQVELAAFGPVRIEDGEVTGEAALRLSFAGRRFETQARRFDIFTNYTSPIRMTNQDGLFLWYAQNGDTGRFSGTLSKGDDVLATLEEEAFGGVVVTFSDGTFVSLQ